MMNRFFAIASLFLCECPASNSDSSMSGDSKPKTQHCASCLEKYSSIVDGYLFSLIALNTALNDVIEENGKPSHALIDKLCVQFIGQSCSVAQHSFINSEKAISDISRGKIKENQVKLTMLLTKLEDNSANHFIEIKAIIDKYAIKDFADLSF